MITQIKTPRQKQRFLNAILPGNDYEFDAADGTDAATSGNLQV